MRALAILFLAACGAPSAADIGGGCKSSSDCHGASCVTDADNFRDGLCTISCKSGSDCPSGDDCVAPGGKSGGVCATACSESEGCKSGYICTEIGRVPSGSAFVCNSSGLAFNYSAPSGAEDSAGFFSKRLQLCL